MPELTPTMAFAVVNRLGSEFDGVAVCAETDHESARLRFPLSIEDGKAEVVPCLILPAPRPIAEAPKTGAILGYVEDDGDWQRCWWVENPNRLQEPGGPDWTNGEERDLTGRMERVYLKWWLPQPPAPQEAQDAR